MTPREPLWDHSRRSGEQPEPRGYIDIHAHLIPGIDDGPPDLEQALEMARVAVASGICTIATTPHLRPDFPNVRLEEIAFRCETLREHLARSDIPLQVFPAAEVSLAWAISASDKQLAQASYAQLGTDILIEAPFTPVLGLDRLLSILQSKGYRVTLAHPERSSQFQSGDRLLRELVDRGVLLQVNAGSLLGPNRDRGRKRLARTLLEEGLAHALASDGHRGSHWRPVSVLADAVAAAGEFVGAERARWLATSAPMAIVNGDELPAAPPVKKAVSRRRLFRLR